jgi:hypothetical protein
MPSFSAGFDSSAPADTYGDYAVDHGHADNEAYQSSGGAGQPDRAPAYGWCAFCRNFTYCDLWRGACGACGACGECRWRWQHYPETMPAGLAAYRAEMPGACSREACAGTSCPVHG